MLKKIWSVVLVAAVTSTLGVMPASLCAQTIRETKLQSQVLTGDELFVENLSANKNLPAEISKLVAGVKAQRDVVTFPRPQLQSPQRNNLSKGTKIAIGVAIAVAVVVVVLVAQRCSNEPGSC